MKIELEHSEEEKKKEEEEKAESRSRKARTKTRYTLKEQWQKFKELPNGEKFWYIWEYYKFHIFAILAAAVILFMVVDAAIKGTRTTVLEGIMMNINYEALYADPITTDYVEAIGLDTKRNVLTIDDSIYTNGSAGSEATYTSLMKITAMIEMKDLDFIITEDEGLAYYGEQGLYLDPQEILPDDFYTYLEDEGRIVYTDVTLESDADGNVLSSESRRAAILLDDTPCDEQLQFVNEHVYFCIICNTTRSAELVNYLYYLTGYCDPIPESEMTE